MKGPSGLLLEYIVESWIIGRGYARFVQLGLGYPHEPIFSACNAAKEEEALPWIFFFG